MEKFNIRHFIFISIAFTTLIHKTYVSILIGKAGNDAFIASAIASAFFIFFVFYIFHVFNKSSINEIKEIYIGALGKPIGYLFLGILIFTVCLTAIESSGSIASVLHTNVFIETPILFYLAIVYLACSLIASKRTSAVITLVIIGIYFISSLGIMLSYLVYPYKKLEFLLPVLKDGINKEFFLSIIRFLGAYSPYFLSFFYLKNIKKTDKLFMPVFIGAIFLIQIVIISLAGTLKTFQIDRLTNMWYPAMLQVQLISQYKTIESGELFVITQVVGGWVLKLSLTLHILYSVIEKIYKQKWANYVITFILFISTYLLVKNIFTWFEFIKKVIYITFFSYMVIPFLIFIIYDIRHRSHK